MSRLLPNRGGQLMAGACCRFPIPWQKERYSLRPAQFGFKIVFLALLVLPAFPVAAQQRPNIVWIMSEDNSKHYLKMFDASGSSTPHIEQMAKHGVTFDRAFSNAPVCSVARTTLITGVHAPRLGTQFHRRLVSANMPDGWEMFPALLRQAGYYTTNNSKKDYNAVEGEGVWDESSRQAHWRNRPAGKPFFHVRTFTDSHESSLHFKQDWVDSPDLKTSPAALELAPYHPDTPLFRLTYASYHDRIQTIDQKVKTVLNELRVDDLLEDTFVFYFGDHGGVLPRSKGYVYESGLHVPLVIRVPEKWKSLSPFAQGSRTQGFVEFVDFGPTVLALAGIPIPEQMDGQPFLGAGIESEMVSSRNETIGYADRMDEKYDLCRSLRRGDWKYIRNYQAIYPDGLQNNYRYLNLAWQEWRELYREGKLNERQKAFFEPKPAEQLFDLSVDPHEVNNLAGDPACRDKLLELRSGLTQRLKSLPDSSFFPESYLVEQAFGDPIAFGRKNAVRIARYIDIADAVLLTDHEAAEVIDMALKSKDPWERYWAFSVCGILGDRASPFFARARIAAESDTSLLVKLRAAEFLGLAKVADPIPAIREIVTASNSPAINLIALQSLVHFKDGPFSYDTKLDTSIIKSVDEQVIRRIGYLDGLSEAVIKKILKSQPRKQ